MPTPAWEPGTLYSPGALVRPRVAQPIVQDAPTNPGFEAGDLTGWTVGDAALSVVAIGAPFEGTYVLRHADQAPYGVNIETRNNNIVPVTPGMSISASCRFRRETDVTGRQGMHLCIFWLDENQDDISSSLATYMSGNENVWYGANVTGVAPAGAAFAQLGILSFQQETGGSHQLYFDAFVWDYTYADPPPGLIFRATQNVAGYSGNTEPTWPVIVGGTVPDNEVTWEGVVTSRVVWEAEPILVSGASEPTWPTIEGATVANGTIAWKAVSRRIEDDRCPNTKVVAIAASKVFAADRDIIPFSATVNPLDWSTANDAGYLAFGLQTYGSNPVSALGLYRSNLIAFNSEGFQMWQVDQDPANMAILDAVPVSCTFEKTPQPVGNDLVFLSPVGVRNMNIAGASTNLQAGNFGEAIDPLVKAAIAADAYEPFSILWPSAGQYWLVFGDEAFVLTVNGPKDMSWSRYEFPEAITDWTLHESELYLRTSTNKVWRVSESALQDDVGGTPVDFEGVIHWPFLDFGNLGVEKQMIGFDLVATAPEGVSVSVGFDQRNVNTRTDDYEVDADTLPGQLVAMPLTAPSFDLRLTFAANQAWEWNAANIHIQDLRSGR